MNDTDAKKLNSTDEGEVITDPELLIEEESEEPADEHEAEPTTIVVSTPVVLPPSASDAAATPAPHPDAADPENRHPGGGVLVLQWLTYAFWFWFSISLSWLAGVVINFYITGGSNGYGYNEALAYPLASVLTLLVIALVTDKLYTKHEPARKTGAANVIMLLHVVPFILVGIGSLVVAIFSLISMVLNNDSAYSSDGPIQAMLVAFVLLTLLTAAAARAFYGNRSRVRIGVWVIFVALAVGFIAAGIAGPAAESLRTKQDRMVEQALPSLSMDIRRYVSSNDKLPASLSDVTHDTSYARDSANVQKLIDAKLVTYKPNTFPSDSGNSLSPSAQKGNDLSVSGTVKDDMLAPEYKAKRFYYQLCTKFDNEKKTENSYNVDSSVPYTKGPGVGSVYDYQNDYLTDVGSHPKGEVCYNLYAEGKYIYDTPVPMDMER